MFGAILALIVRIISNPLANLFQKILTKEYSSILINFYSYLLLAIVSIVGLNFSNFDYHSYSYEFWFYVCSAGLLCTLGSISLIKALEYGQMSVLAPINSYKCIVGLFFGLLLLKEIPTIQEMFGLILIIFGSLFIFGTLKEGLSFDILKRKDVQLRFCALFCTGCEAVILKKIILISSPAICFYFWCITGCIFSLLLIVLFKKRLKLLKIKEICTIVGIALALGLMQYSTNIVFKYINVGISLALFQLSGIVGIIMGYFIFKESNIKLKILGALIMIIGSCFILIK